MKFLSLLWCEAMWSRSSINLSPRGIDALYLNIFLSFRNYFPSLVLLLGKKVHVVRCGRLFLISYPYSKKTWCDRQTLLMGWRGVREEEEISGEDRENNVDQLFVIAGTYKKMHGPGVKENWARTYFNEQVTLFFWFLFLHNEGLTLVILARPKILQGYFVQLLWKLITTYLAVGSPFQSHIFESFGKKKCDSAFLKLRGGILWDHLVF